MSAGSGDDIMRRSMKRMVIWLGIGVALSMSINFGLFYMFGDAAFPWNIFLLVGVFMLMAYMIQKRELKKAGFSRDKKSGGWFSGVKGKGYTCYNCATKHKGDRCPNCGARGGRMSFE